MEIENLSELDVSTPFQMEVKADNDQSTTWQVPSLASLTTQAWRVNIGPGDSCFNPDCAVSAAVDSLDEINESDESNNVAERFDGG